MIVLLIVTIGKLVVWSLDLTAKASLVLLLLVKLNVEYGQFLFIGIQPR